MAREKDTNRSRKAARERTLRTIERYEGKKALAATWKDIDPQYAAKLQNEANKLHDTLVIKGVFDSFDHEN